MFRQLAVPAIGVAALVCMPNSAHGQASATEFIVTLALNAKVEPHLTPFVYVKGELGGVAPGTVVIPRETDGVVIEIGFAQFGSAPLYSFVLGPNELQKKEVNVVVSNFEYKETSSKNFWKEIHLTKNTIEKATIEAVSNAYKLALPSKPYVSIAAIWNAASIKPYDENWFGAILPQNNRGGESGLIHNSYSKMQAKTVALTNPEFPGWTGYYGRTAGILDGMKLAREKLTIISEPAGAAIVTEVGPRGLTTTTIEVSVASTSYITLKKDGYADCPHTKCQKTSTPGGTQLNCTLKKL